MGSSHNHYYYADFRKTLKQASFLCTTMKLEKLEWKERALREAADAIWQERREVANNAFVNHYSVLRPFLRPCHQKRFDETRAKTGLQDAIQMEPRGWCMT